MTTVKPYELAALRQLFSERMLTQTLAERLGWDINTAQRHIVDLVRRGFVKSCIVAPASPQRRYPLTGWELTMTGAELLQELSREQLSTAALIAAQLSAMDGLEQGDRYMEMMQIAKIAEEHGEATEALLAYHDVNPRKDPGPLQPVIDDLCDVALTAKVAIERFGLDSVQELAKREQAVLDRLRAAAIEGAGDGE